MATLKLQYFYFEPGEFTKEIIVDKQTMLTLFNEKTTYKLLTRSYTIRVPLIKFFIQSKDNYLYIEHIRNNQFRVLYCSENDIHELEGYYYIQDVRRIIALFMDDRFDTLSKYIPRTDTNTSHLKSLFIRNEFIYSFKEKNVFLLLFTNVTFILFFLMVVLSAQNIYVVLVYTFMPLFCFYYIRLHLNYIQKSKNISIQISCGNQQIVIWNGIESYAFMKSDILEVYQYNSGHSRLPFSLYSYTRIILNDNQYFDISSMILDHYSLQFKMTNVKCIIKSKFYPYIGKFKPQNH